MLEWIALPVFSDCFWPSDRACISCISCIGFATSATWEAPVDYEEVFIVEYVAVSLYCLYTNNIPPPNADNQSDGGRGTELSLVEKPCIKPLR